MIPLIPLLVCGFGLILVLLILLLIHRTLEKTRREIEELKREAYQTRKALVHLNLTHKHPGIVDSPFFELPGNQLDRRQASALGEMLIKAKENARLQNRL